MKRICILLVLVSVSLCVHEWTELSSNANFGDGISFPAPKEGHSCVSLAGDLVCMSGYVPCFSLTPYQSNIYQSDRLFFFDTDTDRWTSLKAPSSTGDRVFSVMFSDEVHGDIYFGFGANILCGGIPAGLYSDFWRVHVATNTWTDLTSTMIGSPGVRLGAGYAKISDGLFVLTGGLDGTFSAQNDVWYFNVSTVTWTQIQSTVHNDTIRPHGRFDFGFQCKGGICVLDMGDTLEGVPLNDVWTFGVTSHVWTRISTTSEVLYRTAFRHPRLHIPGRLAIKAHLVKTDSKPGDRTQFCSFLRTVSSKVYLFIGFGDADDAPRCDNTNSGYGDNPTDTFWAIRVDIPNQSWTEVTADVIGDARPTKSCACTQIENLGLMWGGHRFTCYGSNTTGVPLLNQNAYSWKIPNPSSDDPIILSSSEDSF